MIGARGILYGKGWESSQFLEILFRLTVVSASVCVGWEASWTGAGFWHGWGVGAWFGDDWCCAWWGC